MYRKFSGGFAEGHGKSVDFGNGLRPFPATFNPPDTGGPDEIHSVIYKECAGSLAYPLSILYNQAYNSTALPNIWKAANVVPVHKSGDTKDVRNYRPISLTCIIMKILERLMYNRLLSLCISKLDSRQHGFLPGRSCLTQLVLFLDDLISNDNERVATNRYQYYIF